MVIHYNMLYFLYGYSIVLLLYYFLVIYLGLSVVCGRCKGYLCMLQNGVELELVECQPLLEWLANNYKNFGATLEIITDKSQEGSQFVRGFGGIGGK